MKISIARMIANLTVRGRALGNRFAWWSRWFPPAPTVAADRFQGESDSYPDHWKEFPRPWPTGQVVGPEALKAALAALWRRWRQRPAAGAAPCRPPRGARACRPSIRLPA